MLKERPAKAARQVVPIQIVDTGPAKIAAPVKPPPPAPRPKPVTRRHHRRPAAPLSESAAQLAPEPPLPTKTEQPGFGASPDSFTEGPGAATAPQGDTVATTPTSSTAPKRIKLKRPAFLSTPTRAPSMKRHPRVKVEHKAGYPLEARSLGVEGSVQVRILVGPDGRVKKARVLSGPGFGLNQAARSALLRYQFHPALDDGGQPREMWITYKYTFIQD